MKGRYYGGLQSVEQQAQICPGVATKKAEFMLDRDHVNVTEIDIIGGTNIITFHILADLELNRVTIS